jgi:outer membrane protein assembly factor BamB
MKEEFSANITGKTFSTFLITPIVESNGTLYFACNNIYTDTTVYSTFVIALDKKTGTKKWSYPILNYIIYSSFVIDYYNQIYVVTLNKSTNGSYLIKFTSEGEVVYMVNLATTLYSRPILSEDRNLLFLIISNPTRLLTINTFDGSLFYTDPRNIVNSIVLFGSNMCRSLDNTVYTAVRNSITMGLNVYAFKDNNNIYQYIIGKPSTSSDLSVVGDLSVTKDNILILRTKSIETNGSIISYVYLINANGNLIKRILLSTENASFSQAFDSTGRMLFANTFSTNENKQSTLFSV